MTSKTNYTTHKTLKINSTDQTKKLGVNPVAHEWLNRSCFL